MIDQIELKNMHSKELRILRNMIREELDFRADIGSEIDERSSILIPAFKIDKMVVSGT